MREFTAVSLFCGAGGLDMGFERAGFRTIWANDFDKDACKTHQNWSRAKVVCGDIGKVDISQIPDSDIILGGFPCQGFSLSGPRKIDDSRNVLYKHYVRIVKEKQPLIFVGENVKGLLTMGDGKIIEAIIAEFSDCGYDVFLQLVNAKDFGVPQDRERVIICGFRKDLKIKNFEETAILQNNDGRKGRIICALSVLSPVYDLSGDDGILYHPGQGLSDKGGVGGL